MSAISYQFRFLRLEVWQEGRKLYGLVSRLVRKFPGHERFGLTSQLRRSARSVCANIAEGSGRNSDPDFAQFVEISYGSAMEVASDAILAADEGYLTSDESEAILTQVAVVTARASGLYARLTGKKRSGIQPSALRLPPRGEAT